MRSIALALLSLAFLLLSGTRTHLDFLEPEESLYAIIPRDMLIAGEFVVPVLRGEPYLDKPPLLCWAVIGSYQLFGVNVVAARLVPVAAAWLTVVVVWLWGRACGGPMPRLVAAGVLPFTGDFVYRGPMLTPNGLLALFTTAGLACGRYALRQERIHIGWWIVSACATGFAVLTKGPVAIVPVATPLFALLVKRHGVRWRSAVAGVTH